MLIVNGHGGNSFAAEHLAGGGVRWHDWWSSDRQRELIVAMGGRLARVVDRELPVDAARRRRAARRGEADGGPDPGLDERPRRGAALGDGSFGGAYQRPDGDMQQLWDAAVAEIRALLES